jgi:multidrug efflux pump subunit AcrA (membrane-fusion protein)
MSDLAVEPVVDVVEASDVEAEPVTPVEPAVDYAAEAKKWKDLSRQNEAKAKANADAAKKLQALEDSAKPEAERVASALKAAQAERDELVSANLRYRAAAKFGVSEDVDLELLGSGDAEQIEARGTRVGQLLAAEKENVALKAELKALKTGKPAGRPVEAMKPGATPSEIEPTVDLPDSWFPSFSR